MHNKSIGSNLTKLFFGSLLIGLPIVTLEAKANMHEESMPQEEMNVDESTPIPNTSDQEETLDTGYDGEPVVTITPAPEDGTVDVTLRNNTNAAIDYQAIGYTENQTLEGGEVHTLINLPVPVVIRSARQDDGFIKVQPIDTGAEGTLQVGLEEDPEFYDDNNIGVIRIEEDGGVFLN